MTNQHLMKKYTKGKLWKNVGVLPLICQKSKSTNPDSKIFNVLADENFLYRILRGENNCVDISYLSERISMNLTIWSNINLFLKSHSI